MANSTSKTKSELSKNDLKILVIVLMVIITVLGCLAEIMFWSKPTAEELTKAEQTYETLLPKVDEAKRVPDQILYYRNEIAILEGRETDGSEDDVELRQEIDVPTILTIVESSASAAKLQLTSIAMDGNAAYIKGGIIQGEITNPSNEVMPEESVSSFYKLGVSMQVKTVTYDGLMQFLQNVEDAGYYITTSSASLTSNDGGKTYSGTLNFHIYSLVATSK
jgi:hypothetical protein